MILPCSNGVKNGFNNKNLKNTYIMKKKVSARQAQKEARQEKEGKKVVEWIFGVLVVLAILYVVYTVYIMQ